MNRVTFRLDCSYQCYAVFKVRRLPFGCLPHEAKLLYDIKSLLDCQLELFIYFNSRLTFRLTDAPFSGRKTELYTHQHNIAR